MKEAKAREYFELAEDEELLVAKGVNWIGDGKLNVTQGRVAVTDKRLVFRGRHATSMGHGLFVDAATNKVIEKVGKRKRELNFVVPLEAIKGGKHTRYGKFALRGPMVLDVETPERTFRLVRRTDFEEELKQALRDAGREVSDLDESGWAVSD